MSFLFTAGFLIVLLLFMQVFFAVLRRLEAQHPATWRELGEPRPWKLEPYSRLKAAGFIYLSGRHRSLGDATLTTYVYSLRALVIMVLVGFGLKFFGGM